MVQWLYERDSTLRDPYDTTLAARIHEPTFRTLVGSALVAKARIVKDLGNAAVHEAKAVPPDQAVTALRELFHLSYWLARTYARGRQAKPRPRLLAARPAAHLADRGRHAQATAGNRAHASPRLSKRARRRNSSASPPRRSARSSTPKSPRCRRRSPPPRRRTRRSPDTHDYDEATTRDAFIDLLLQEVGWTFDQAGHDTEYPVTGMPNASGEGFVDYVLWGDDGKPLGLVEAKRTRRDPRVGQQQAKLYADCLEKQFGQRPIIFYYQRLRALALGRRALSAARRLRAS